ncbi:CHRD domain-containing protein [Paenibacillus sp. sptzw28]|nr:CHRD domain-containing protein [Paenibacillus sp. sptzw28]
MVANFVAKLRGRFEVPPVDTDATGMAWFRLSSSGERLHFLLKVKNIERVTEAHIHLGAAGENGPIIAFLFGPNKFGITVRKGIVRGSLTSEDLVGPLKGSTIEDLVKLMQTMDTYVNVHTVQNPDGEIRGQIQADSKEKFDRKVRDSKKSAAKVKRTVAVKRR